MKMSAIISAVASATAAKGKVALPSHFVGVSSWESASTRLDRILADMCKKAGCYVQYVSGGHDERELAVIVAKAPITDKDKNFVKKNWYNIDMQG